MFALTSEEFIRHHHNRKLLEAINDAYDDLPDAEEQSLHQKMRQRHRHLVKEQWQPGTSGYWRIDEPTRPVVGV
ncbi:MAG: hypothetical protein GXP41_12910 [Chloroflexi bacterium]|nr:hypothetical protein [Chloroflexota bacterium]